MELVLLTVAAQPMKVHSTCRDGESYNLMIEREHFHPRYAPFRRDRGGRSPSRAIELEFNINLSSQRRPTARFNEHSSGRHVP
jgi:hypothetical protein